MAKRKSVASDSTLPPEEDRIHVEVLPGVLVDVQPQPSLYDSEMDQWKKNRWPQLLAARPMIGELIFPIAGKGVATVEQIGHLITADHGPILRVWCRFDLDE